MAAELRDIKRHVLPNGLVVVTETMNHVRSVSIGVWIRNGSRREACEQTVWLTSWSTWFQRNRTQVRRIKSPAKWTPSAACSMPSHPRSRSASTPKFLDDHLPIAFDIISDLCSAEFDSEDVDKERQVVLEEIKMDLDNPESLLHEIFTRLWPEHPLGRPILGTPDTVKQFSREALQARFKEWFAPGSSACHRCRQRAATKKFLDLRPA